MRFIKTIFPLVFLICNADLCLSQSGQWTWIKGDSTSNNPGNYGTQGVSSPLNYPPSLYEACEFKDLNGNFWFYGGLDQNGGNFMHNDLWKFDPVTNEWTWVKGTNTRNDPGVFGTQGVSSPGNRPPGFSYGAPSWVDTTGKFWVYGGASSNQNFGDLWRYDPAMNEWTWMKGNGGSSQLPVYGNMTVPNINNTPGSVNETSAAWTDKNNDLWFFGGYNNGLFNTLWRYNIATNTWTWMKGTATMNAPGNWGTMGVEDPANVPSGRYAYARWMDIHGNFWLFGGFGDDAVGVFSYLNDLWRYNPVTNNWTWMSGSNLQSSILGTYGSECVAASSNRPTGRAENRAAWTDTNGDFWMFGGGSYISSNIYGLNDLWKYCVATNTWVWMSGDSTANIQGRYGVMGVTDSTNVPGERNGAIGWTGNNGSLYLFGGFNGFTNVLFNDLWRYDIDTSCTPCTPNGALPSIFFGVSNNAFCEGSCITLSNQSVNATSYSWLFPGGNPSNDTSANPQNICYQTQGSYDITLIATNSFGSDSLTISNAILVYPPVAFAPIHQSGDTLFSLPGFVDYLWFIDQTPINGATNYFYVATQTGNYSVQVIDSNGCTAAATLINVIASTGNIAPPEIYFTIHVLENVINLDIQSRVASPCDVQLTDALGKEIYQRKFNLNPGRNLLELQSTNLSSGFYFIKIYSENGLMTKKVFVN